MRRSILGALLAVMSCTTCMAQGNPEARQAQTPPTTAAQAKAKGRLTIGVALEGGGALGEAHIGVLRWFEEHHVPVDYIAGTSMGALVGGLYATGKPAHEINAIVKGADWPLLLGGGTPYEDLSFRRKEDAREIPNALEIGLRNGPTLPPSLNSGHQVNLLVNRETLPYSTIKSFDELPIPFRSVSTELVSGQAHVFRDGSLSDAMRASMSIPGVFAPVQIDNQIFVDGGMVDNLPTDVVRDMGADVVIAVHLQIAPSTAKEIQSAFSVLRRSVELVIAATEIRGMEGADLIVKADVEKFSTTDYEKTDQLAAIGYAAADAKAALLKPYELDDAAWAEYLREKQARVRTQIGVPQFVRVVGVGGESLINLEKFLARLAGKPVDQGELEQLLTRLTGLGRYDSVTYSMVREGGQDGLLIRVHEKTYAPPSVRPAFLIDGTQTDNVTYTLATRLTFIDVAGHRSEWRTDLEFGETYGIRSELYRPIRPFGRWFVAPIVAASDSAFFVYGKSNPQADYRLDRVLGEFDIGYGFNRFSEVRAGYELGYTDAGLRLGAAEFSSYEGRLSALHVRYILDHTNEAVIPTRGFYVQGNFYFYDTFPNAKQAFPLLELTAQYFQPVFHKDSIFAIANGGSTFGYRNTGVPQFFLGGVGRLSAYGLNELQGNQYFLGRLGYLKKVFTLPRFVGKQVYAAGYGEIGKMYGDPFAAPHLSVDGAAGVLAETSLGPVFIGGSAGDSGHGKWFFQLGRVF